MLEGVDDADVFVTCRPDASRAAGAEAFQCRFVGKFGEVKHLVSQFPYSGGKRLVFLNRNDVNWNGNSRRLANDSPVKRQLVDVSVTAAVGLKPFQTVAGFEIDRPSDGLNQSMRIWHGTPQHSARITPSASPLASSSEATGWSQTPV